MRVPVSTVYAAFLEILCVLGLSFALHAVAPGLGVGWILLIAVAILAALGVLLWVLVADRLSDGMPYRVLTKFVLVNVALVVVSPLVPLAKWLHNGLGLPKQLAGGIFIVLAIILLFVVFTTAGKVAGGGKRRQTTKSAG